MFQSGNKRKPSVGHDGYGAGESRHRIKKRSFQTDYILGIRFAMDQNGTLGGSDCNLGHHSSYQAAASKELRPLGVHGS